MNSRVNVEYVWKKIWRRLWVEDENWRISKIWRRVLKRVPVNYSPPVPCPQPSTDPQLITYKDCEAFFEAVTEGSRMDIFNMLNIHGPEVITQLSKSYNEHGETPLLVSIKKGNVDMVKCLVGKLDVPIGQIGRFVWKGVEYVDVPALYVAIVRGEMGIAAYLLSTEVESNQTAQIIDSILSSPNERQVKINILELMGAINFYFYESHPKPQNGLMYWRAAMNLRQPTIDGEPAMPKNLLPSDLGLFTSEFTTLEQLEELTALDLFIQAILVSQRVLNTVSPGPHICTLIFMCQCAWIYSSCEGQRGRALCILTFILQQSEELQWKEYKKSQITNWALDIMMKIITDLRQKRYNPSQEELTVANLMATFDFATNHMSALLENDQQEVEPDTINHLANFILEMIFLLNEMMPQFNWEQRKQFERSLSLYIRKDHRWGLANRNLLHTICDCSSQIPAPLACNDELNDLIDNADVLDFSNDIESDIESDQESDLESDAAGSESNGDDDILRRNIFDDYNSDVSGCPCCAYGNQRMMSDDESDDEDFELIRHRREDLNIRNVNDDMLTAAENLQLSVTQLILRLGADPNAIDRHGYTPLHLLAMDRGSVAQSRILLDYGAHVHQTDSMNRTPLMHFQEWQRQLDNQGNPDLNLQFMIGSVLPLPLSVLAAQVVSKHQIFPFDKEQVPSVLHSFTPTSLNYSDGYSE
uniref:Ankyrin repeat domain-containing protein 54 n=1 Tax=Daphnia galeata TaxID=27404 RepID=A0A8J2RT36_9CRUS|nr:unnamed protein product [Daphnia galeata]